jgi:protein involved in polysaccharide export with SLBB domain
MLWAALTCGIAAAAPEDRVIVTGRGRLTEIPYSTGLTVSKAIIAAGGYSDFSRTAIHLIRCARSTRLDMDAILRGERQSDVQLQPWDIITIGNTIVHRK